MGFLTTEPGWELLYLLNMYFEEFKKYFLLSRFLLQCLEDLDANLRKLNSRLFVIRGQPADVFPRLFKVIGKLIIKKINNNFFFREDTYFVN